MGWCRCINGEAPRARPVACAGNGVGCVTREAGAGAVVGGGADVADERPHVCSNREAAASAGDSILVSEVLTWGEGRCRRASNGDVAVRTDGSSGPRRSS